MSTREVACSRYGVNIVQHMYPFSKFPFPLDGDYSFSIVNFLGLLFNS